MKDCDHSLTDLTDVHEYSCTWILIGDQIAGKKFTGGEEWCDSQLTASFCGVSDISELVKSACLVLE